ncbi:hypothetical protein ABFS82_13G181400 [Erythranthe guttata]|uniref:Serine aminopeptidase S33 domain-containing protein n=1 Tax=Erythranthe guttata TaxID=4155 RepID=A0A022PTJ6_ERYGU|nr:PREDICTED: caffeoylshikimate esterase-like [Erythranthe guttata]EYU19116.1 hypothetical protein MIMGU_mgv1a027063mg [Erythranthe guttata]|eukprot:XP_012827389.1 PREDICTED: caffeoylshikimate esterase-like [Erythranthe guttata]
MSHPIHEANENSPYGDLTKEEFYKKHHIFHQQSFMLNNHNMKIFTQSWQPADSNPNPNPSPLNGFVGMIHGYTSESSWLFELNAVAIAKAGFFVCALDLQGHGLSQGPHDHISDINPLVQDCLQFFDSKRADYRNIPHFMYGESLGAAIAILVCLQQRTMRWRGLIVAGAMCEVSNKYKPMWPLEKLLPIAALIAPNWRIWITRAPTSRSYRERWKRVLVERSPNRRSCGKPTAGTALQLLRVCDCVREKCADLDVAMLILHGGGDVICDPKGARFLYETAASEDKTLRIFEGMWHQLIGESNEGAQQVFDTMLEWIQARTM